MDKLTVNQKNILIMALTDYKFNMIKNKDFRFVDVKYANDSIKEINTICNLLTNQ